MSRRLRAERGQTSVEYLGVIVVVAVILAGLIAATPGGSSVVGTGLRRAVCLIARSDSCPKAHAKTPLRPAVKPKGRGDGGPWNFLKDRAGDVADAAKATAGFVGDVGVGAYDSVKGTLTMGFELSPTRAAIDPEGFLRDARKFGEGTWYGITHPKELGKALIDWPDLTGGHPGRAVGQWVPDIALLLLTGGLGTAADGGAEAARGLSRAEKAAESTRDLSRAEKAAAAARVAEKEAISPEAEQIASGHAFDKHVVGQGEYPEYSTREEFARHIDDVIKNPSESKPLSNGRSAYWDESSDTVVITNPNDPHGGTAFRPSQGKAYYENLR
jgi:hypothetical protein